MTRRALISSPQASFRCAFNVKSGGPRPMPVSLKFFLALQKKFNRAQRPGVLTSAVSGPESKQNQSLCTARGAPLFISLTRSDAAEAP